jgi:hypothetical protein
MLAIAAWVVFQQVGPVPKPAADKTIRVWVIPAGGGAAEIDIESVTATDKDHGAIWWKLETAGYSFPANGIAAGSGSPALPAGCKALTAGQFNEAFHTCQPMPPGNTKFKCVRKGNYVPDKCYKYVVTVAASGVPAAPPLDPWIKNEP